MSQSSRLRLGIAIATVATALCAAVSASAKPPAAATYQVVGAPQIATVDAGGGNLTKLVRTLLRRARYRGKDLTSKAEERFMKSLRQSPSRRLAKKRIQNYYCYQWYSAFGGSIYRWSSWRGTNTWAGWSYRYCWLVRYRPIWKYLYG